MAKEWFVSLCSKADEAWAPIFRRHCIDTLMCVESLFSSVSSATTVRRLLGLVRNLQEVHRHCGSRTNMAEKVEGGVRSVVRLVEEKRIYRALRNTIDSVE